MRVDESGGWRLAGEEGFVFGVLRLRAIWEFPKMRGTLYWGPYNKDPAI